MHMQKTEKRRFDGNKGKKKSVECEKKKKEQAWKTATLDIIAGVVAITSGNTQTITEKQPNYTRTNWEDGASRIAPPF